ncbi:MAG: radical SAM family heme chaperone HemW, partial [Nitriliruptoraceae bacterium]
MTADGDRRWLDAPVESGRRAGFGVYLHVPFCRHRCGYCDFATEAVGDEPDAELFDRYVDALSTDLAGQARRTPGGPTAEHTGDWPTVTSIFIGGGTPTLLGGDRLAVILAQVRDELAVADDAEITVECNPETASPALFDALVAAGVTRVSMGAQSFTPAVLETLERGHDPQVPPAAVAMARQAGIPAVSLDLIYGTPGETPDAWANSLATALATGIDHLSAYALTVHPNTPFGRAVAAGTQPDVDDDRQRDDFEDARATLAAAGFDHYEVSNFARDAARRSAHNVLYWRHGDYLAAGVGAHGHLDGARWWMTRSTSRYLAALESGAVPVAGSEQLSDDERAVERLMLGLRVREGLHPHDLPPL